GEAVEKVSFEDAEHGRVHLQLWRGLGFRKKGRFFDVEVIRSRIHLENEKPPKEHWYIAYNGKPEQSISVRQWYETITHRWAIEPANRFRKERLYAELPKVRAAAASDLWLQLLQVVEWELYLWRPAANDAHLPWQKPLAPEQLTPGRVIRSLSENLDRV